MIIPYSFPFGFIIVAGALFSMDLNWADDSGNVYDLTGWHARLRLFDNAQNLSLVTQLTDGSGITLSDGTAGPASPNISASIPGPQTTFAVAPNYCILDLQDPSGNWGRLFEDGITYNR